MACARSTRVLKKIEPNQAGALKWAQRYGASLLCVRYRLDPRNAQRLTTVELIVDRADAAPPGDKSVLSVSDSTKLHCARLPKPPAQSGGPKEGCGR